MQLGTMLARLEDDATAAAALHALDDIVLLARIETTGAEHDESPGEYVANASRRFAAQAGDEDWLGVMTAVERADDPGRAVLRRMLDWALAQDAMAGSAPSSDCGQGSCTCGGGGGGRHGQP